MTNHIHKLTLVLACEQCLIDRCRERDLLLKFVKELSKKQYCECFNSDIISCVPCSAKKLIEEITEND